MLTPLGSEQLETLPQGTSNKHKPARIMCEGKSVNITSGDQIGGNVIYQYVYWDRPPEFLRLVIKMLGENNSGKRFRIAYSE